jgi:hypothetical protein
MCSVGYKVATIPCRRQLLLQSPSVDDNATRADAAHQSAEPGAAPETPCGDPALPARADVVFETAPDAAAVDAKASSGDYR